MEMVLLHPTLKFNLTELKLAKTTLNLEIHVDHLFINIKLGNVQVFDLSDYPYTIISQNQYKEENKKEILGFNNESSMEINVKLYDKTCALFKDNYSTDVEVVGNSVVFVYYNEQILRFIDYVMNEIIGIKSKNTSSNGSGTEDGSRNENNAIKESSDKHLERIENNNEKTIEGNEVKDGDTNKEDKNVKGIANKGAEILQTEENKEVKVLDTSVTYLKLNVSYYY